MAIFDRFRQPPEMPPELAAMMQGGAVPPQLVPGGMPPGMPPGIPPEMAGMLMGPPPNTIEMLTPAKPEKKKKRPKIKAEDEDAIDQLAKQSEDEFTRSAYNLFREFHDAHQPFWASAKENELFYQSREWDTIKGGKPDDPKPTTPAIQAAVDGLKADRMDGYPEAIILPQKLKDKDIARQAEHVVKHVLELGDHYSEYEKQVHDSNICGWQITETGWDVEQHYGLGEAYVRRVDPRCFMADPKCEDIQDGRACFKFTARSRDWMRQHYPDKYPEMGSDINAYSKPDDNAPVKDDQQQDDMLLIEFWYRVYDGDRYRVHMALLGGGVLLERSEDAKPEGYYMHGQYPFVVQPLYPIAGTPLGFGLVDALKNPQMYADKLDQIIMRNALLSSKTKMIVNRGAEIDEDALLDGANEIVHANRIDDQAMRWFQTAPLQAPVFQLREKRLAEIKEYSGVNDMSRGQAGGGVTAASAIMALQEAASKRARLAERGDHAAFAKAVRQLLEVIREFYTDQRTYIVTDDDGEEQEAQFSGDMLYSTGEMTGERIPIEFHVSNKVQRQNVYRTAYYNDFALQLIQLGILTPPEALEMMHFEGVDKIRSKVSERMDLQAQMEQLAQENEALKQELAQQESPQVQHAAETVGAWAGDSGEAMPGAEPMDGEIPPELANLATPAI